MSDLKEGSHLGRDEYPKSVAGDFDLLNRASIQLDKYNPQQQGVSRRSGDNFFQTGDEGNSPVPGTDGRLKPDILCYNCNRKGHYAGQCLEEDRRGQDGSTSVQIGSIMVQADSNQDNSDDDFYSGNINRDWLLLDTCSTHCVGCNENILSDIRACEEDEVLHITTNGGALQYDQIGMNKLVPVAMHFNPKSIANVLSLSVVADIPGTRIIMDTSIEKAIEVHMKNGNILKFEECTDGLYY